MSERRRPWYVEFTTRTKKQVYEEQGGLCVFCGFAKIDQYHHCRPVKHKGTRERCNCVGACRGDHRLANKLALKYGFYFEPVAMEEGTEYSIFDLLKK